ncbi:MAG: FliH/SctL family protein [Proteobacteria bacterium]|nr:FliH/SctL family protein [Pseudomonadota bacterium]
MSETSDIVPFLQAIAAATISPMGASLPTLGPRPVVIDHVAENAAARQAAMVAGRDAGLQETAALRDTLTKLAAGCATAKDARAGELADLVAAAAITVIEAWLGTLESRERLAPVIRGWLEGEGGKAVASVHPSEVEAACEAVGDAAITVVGDDTVNPGDIRIRGGERDLTHAWRNRLDDLRSAITAELASARELQ